MSSTADTRPGWFAGPYDAQHGAGFYIASRTVLAGSDPNGKAGSAVLAAPAGGFSAFGCTAPVSPVYAWIATTAPSTLSVNVAGVPVKFVLVDSFCADWRATGAADDVDWFLFRSDEPFVFNGRTIVVS